MLNRPEIIYKKLSISDWEKTLYTYTNISFFDDDNTNTRFKWQMLPESEIIDKDWKNNDYRDILKVSKGEVI
jgi:hypothetical protein